jgi:aspartyl-tRNA(Asn)/glutamyl-tRNA(Gln) amidotransferase subunit A
LPGSFCGVVGLKQTFGRVSQRGLLVTSYNGDHIGPLTRSVRDSALVLQAIAGYDPLDPSTVPVSVPDYTAHLGRDVRGLKMGIPTDYYFDLVDPEVETAVRHAIAALEKLGMARRAVALPMMQYAGALRIAGMADSLVVHEPFLATRRQDYGPDVLYRTLAGQFVLARDYAKAMKVQRLIKEEYARVLQEVDVLITPTAPVPAPPIGAKTVTLGGSAHAVRGPGSGMISRNTSPSNATGLPAISVPCGFTAAGLPIGLQCIARPFEEALLFQVAHAYEAVSPAHGRLPGLVTA